MAITIRPARLEDREAIAAFTRETFSWGDYVADALSRWLGDPRARTMVGADGADTPVAVATASMVSPDEAWAQGARVHPDYRRSGLATSLGTELIRWASDQGAHVIRLLIEEWNKVATAQVAKIGYRPTGRWFMAQKAVPGQAPAPGGNGGRRVGATERLQLATSAEAEPAYIAWTSGELARAARTLFPEGWIWRRLTPDDLNAAARREALWEGIPGWALAELEDTTFSVSWLETSRQDADGMVRALVDAGVATEAGRIEAKFPAVGWLVGAFRAVGAETMPMIVFTKGL